MNKVLVQPLIEATLGEVGLEEQKQSAHVLYQSFINKSRIKGRYVWVEVHRYLVKEFFLAGVVVVVAEVQQVV